MLKAGKTDPKPGDVIYGGDSEVYADSMADATGDGALDGGELYGIMDHGGGDEEEGASVLGWMKRTVLGGFGAKIVSLLEDSKGFYYAYQFHGTRSSGLQSHTSWVSLKLFIAPVDGVSTLQAN
jgi:hypothetical protein